MTITLNRLPLGQSAEVEQVDTDKKIGRRLRELGVYRGGTVTFVGVAPLGDPITIRAMDTLLALRLDLAAHIRVRTGSSGTVFKPSDRREYES